MRLLATLIVSTLAVLSWTTSAQADDITWQNTPLSLQKLADLPAGTPPPYSINGNRDCQQYSFVTRPKNLIQPEQSHLACGVQTQFGMADSNGWVELSGTQLSGKFVNYPGYSLGFIPIPYSKRFISYNSSPQGLYLYFTDFSQRNITITANLDQSVDYLITQPPGYALRDKSGALLQTHSDSLAFSTNGKWMVIDSPGRALLRVNLETLDVLPFAPSFRYDIGVAPGLQTAITSDGRYAVVYSYSFNTFKIYDLASCASVPNAITQPVSCQSKDLLPILQTQISGFRGVSQLRFASQWQLRFYANRFLVTGDPSTNRIAKYSLSVGENPASQADYLAMGDSYISGEGAYSYRAGTDTSTNHCHQSLVSYPYLIGAELNLNNYHSVACSGAVNWDIAYQGLDYKGQVKDGISASKRDRESILYGFSPGMLPQLDFVSYSQPKAVTVSIGGNDIGFSTILRRCLEPDTCYETYEDRLEIVRQIDTVLPKLINTYSQIKNNAPQEAHIYAIGYPQLAYAQGSCGVNVRLSSQEIEFASQLISYLNNIIRVAAERTGVNYIDTQDALNGHRLCETKGSNTAVNGITAGSDQPDFLGGPIGNETYHPNTLGHQLLAEWIKNSTNSFAEPTKGAQPNSQIPLENDLEILSVPKTGRVINKLNYDDTMSNNIAYREAWLKVTIDSLKLSLKPASIFLGILQSEPTELGNISSDSEGNLAGQLYIPASVSPGMHALHIYGKNSAGESIDITKAIYIAANATDADGDEIPDTNDSCKFIENSAEDIDMDGVDDACDGQITEPHAATPPPADPVEIGGTTKNENKSVATDSIEQQIKIGGNIPFVQNTTLALGVENDQSGYIPKLLTSYLAPEPEPITAGDANADLAAKIATANPETLGAFTIKQKNKTNTLPESANHHMRYGLVFLGASLALGYLFYKQIH